MEEKSVKEVTELIEKYDFKSSWYADYPPTGYWQNDFSEENYREALNLLVSKGENNPLSLYVHFPFCARRCFYCVCPSKPTNNHEKVKEFLKYQFKEFEMLRDFFDKKSFKPNILSVHFGGGSPSLMDKDEIDDLVKEMSLIVNMNKLKEFSIEIDPRTADEDKLIHYSKLGINRISLGVQDFNPEVQKAINRVQPIELIERLLTPELRKRFRSINFDLITGLPFQTRESFRETTDKVIEFSPDKISSSFLCYMPELLRHQRLMDASKMPNFHESTMIFLESYKKYLENGYVYIGMGHFAKPTEPLAIAQRNKKLRRTAMGYVTGISEDLIGVGPSAMGEISNYYFQNEVPIENYYQKIQKGQFPIFRGYTLTKDDLLRREIIKNIICFFSVNFDEIKKKYNVDIREYFKKELSSLQPHVEEGILEMNSDGFSLTSLGVFFQRNICAAFDKFFQEKREYRHSRNVEF